MQLKSMVRTATLMAAFALPAVLAGCGGDEKTTPKTTATTAAKSTAASTAAPKATTASTPASTPKAAATTPAAAAAETVAVELGEWKVAPGAATAKAGKVTFNVKNGGAAPHELAVIKADDPAALAKDAAARVDETKTAAVGRTKQINGGATESLEVTLTAGKYVLLCNLPGHYDLGMRTAFTVN